MFDKDLFEKICKVACTFEELEEFSRGINEKEFDLDNPFAKYYSLDSILQCINLRKKGFVSDKFLAHWANAYNWIVMGGFETNVNNEKEISVSLETVLIWAISDWLDSLSFFDGDKEFIKLIDYKKAFTTLDSIFTNHHEWTSYYSYTNEEYADGDFVNSIFVLLVNESKSLYFRFYSDCCDFKECVFENAQHLNDVEDKEKQLKKSGYKKLQIGLI